MVDKLHIARRKIVPLLYTFRIFCRVETAARLSTHTAVCRLSAQKTGKKAQTGLTYTQRTMDEHFNLGISSLLYLLDFLKPKLACKNNALQAFL